MKRRALVPQSNAERPCTLQRTRYSELPPVDFPRQIPIYIIGVSIWPKCHETIANRGVSSAVLGADVTEEWYLTGPMA